MASCLSFSFTLADPGSFCFLSLVPGVKFATSCSFVSFGLKKSQIPSQFLSSLLIYRLSSMTRSSLMSSRNMSQKVLWISHPTLNHSHCKTIYWRSRLLLHQKTNTYKIGLDLYGQWFLKFHRPYNQGLQERVDANQKKKTLHATVTINRQKTFTSQVDHLLVRLDRFVSGH